MKPLIDETHDPALKSWVESANGHADFPIQNLPLGIVAPGGGTPRAAVAVGDAALDLRAAAAAGLVTDDLSKALSATTLNDLLAMKGPSRRMLRRRVSELLSEERHRAAVEPLLFDRTESDCRLPASIGDYTDFYVGIHHATNVGRLFRPDNPLLPNFKYVPIGYHGRASSIRPSGIPVMRPKGQRKSPDGQVPSFGPTLMLDYELELGIWLGEGNRQGHPVEIGDAEQHIAGFCLLNDWSARDIQAWEYQPLGPFLAKSFHTTISPWIVTSEAMTPFRVAQSPRPDGDPAPLPYLFDEDDQRFGALSIELEVKISSATMRRDGLASFRLSQGSSTNMYWTISQMLAHHTSNGCNLNPGDLLGSGTISGPSRVGFGSLLEITAGGREPLSLPSGETRRFLEDNDEIVFTARATTDGYVPIGLGECRGLIVSGR
jgi:fumarylacetoacetase